MPLAKVIHYPDTNSVEAIWVDENGVQTKCHSYADVQMDMLRADLGESLTEYVDLIALVEANISPPAEKTAEEKSAEAIAMIYSLESSTLLPRVTREFMLTFFAAQATAAGVDPESSPAYAKVKALDTQISELRKGIIK